MRISPRLLKIAQLVPACETVADIGTDHAYLPIFLVQRAKCQHAIAVDVNEGPYLRAVKQVKRAQLADRIEVRLGNGLSVIDQCEKVDVYIFAGMGGELIFKLIMEGNNKISGSSTLILQPMQDAPLLRKLLIKNGYYILDEELVKEKSKIYDIIIVKRGEQKSITPLLMEVGPKLWESKHPLLFEKMELLLKKYRKILSDLEKHKGDSKLKQETITNIEGLEMMLECLSKFKP